MAKGRVSFDIEALRACRHRMPSIKDVMVTVHQLIYHSLNNCFDGVLE